MLKGGFLLATTKGTAMFLRFVRGIIIARIVSPADFGIAATFAMTVSFLEMISNLGPERMLVQAVDGDERRLQNTSHFILFFRGILLSAGLLILADPVAGWFGVPHAAWAFRWLAIIPLFRGFMHLDLVRFERTLNFSPSAWSQICCQVILTLMAWPLAYWLRDFSAMLWLSIAEAMAMLGASHWFSQRPYRWSIDWSTTKRFLKFGWPLLINGLLMFGIFQGDRVIVGSLYNIELLGIYSIAFTLTMLPTTLLSELHISLFLPVLSRVQNDPLQFHNRSRFLAVELCTLASMISVLFLILGGKMVVLVYGAKYSAASEVLGWLAVFQAVRLMRAGPVLASLAKADTRNSLYSNIIRSLALAAGILVGIYGMHLKWLAFSAICGESAAFVYSVFRLARKHGVPLNIWISPFLATFGILAGVALCGNMLSSHASWGLLASVSLGLAAGGTLLMLLLFEEFRHQCLTVVGRLQMALGAST